MTNILSETPSIEPRLITRDQLEFMSSRFEREIIDPLFFGRLDDDPKQVQAEIDDAVESFNRFVSDNFEISNQHKEF